MLEVNWKGTPTGGSCNTGCHSLFEYDRLEPVVYPERPDPEGRDWRGHDQELGSRAEPRIDPAPQTEGGAGQEGTIGESDEE